MFSSLLSTLEKSHKLVVAAVEQKQKEAEKRIERLAKDLEKEILELKNGHTNPEHLDDKERLKKVTAFSFSVDNFFVKFDMLNTKITLLFVLLTDD